MEQDFNNSCIDCGMILSTNEERCSYCQEKVEYKQYIKDKIIKVLLQELKDADCNTCEYQVGIKMQECNSCLVGNTWSISKQAASRIADIVIGRNLIARE